MRFHVLAAQAAGMRESAACGRWTKLWAALPMQEVKKLGGIFLCKWSNTSG